MDLLVTDNQFNGLGLVEDYESLIWTERYSEIGDFEFFSTPDPYAQRLLRRGNLVQIADSQEVMIIEQTETPRDVEGELKFLVKGRSFESSLEGRAVPPGFRFDGSTINVIYELLRVICVRGEGIYPEDVIPNFAVPPNVSGPIIRPLFGPGQLYATIKELLDTEDLGFRINLQTDGRLLAEVYAGAESRLTFDPALDNIAATTYLESDVGYYNIAYVYSKTHAYTVYAKGTPRDVTGLDRRVLTVDATSVETDDYDYMELLGQKGREALGEHRRTKAFDGVIDPNSSLVYGRDFFLGDIMTAADELGNTARSRVTEFIRAQDAEGYREYPTLTVLEKD